MGLKSFSGKVLAVVGILFVVALMAGQLLGQPTVLGFARSGSMEPTIGKGDGYFVVPKPLIGGLEEGDVVVYKAEQMHGGGLVVHRIVGRTDRGFVTKGDANPFTDQESSSNEPYVKEGQVVGEVVKLGRGVVTIPALGTLVTGIRSGVSMFQRRLAIFFRTRALLGTQGLAFMVGAFGIVLLAWSSLSSGGRDRSRSRRREPLYRYVPHVFLASFAIVVLLSTFAVSQPLDVGYVAVDTEGVSAPRVGTTFETNYKLTNKGFIPCHVFLEPGGESVSLSRDKFTLGVMDKQKVTAEIQVPEETGYYHEYVSQHRCLAILPFSTALTLYSLNPWLPALVADLILIVPLVFVYFVWFSGSRIRTREGTGFLSRIRRKYF